MKRLNLLAIILVLGAITSGCGNSSKSDVINLTVAVANNSKPVSYVDEDGTIKGFEVDILRAADERMQNYDFTIEAVAQEAEEIGIDTGKYALIGEACFKTAEREEKYLFTDENTGVSLIKLYTLNDKTDINSLADLKGYTLAPVPPNGGLYNLLTAYNEENPDATVDFSTAESVPIAERFQQLLDGTYDAVIWPSANLDLDAISKSLGTEFRSTNPVKVNPTYFLISKDQQDFYNGFNKVITELKNDGTLSKISVEYYGEDVFQYK